MTLLLLCWEFFKIGLFAVGGGMATIPFLAELSHSYPHWFSMSMLADMIAISEATPGPIGVNMATYVGFSVSGVLGAVLATFSLVLPAFLTLLLVARALHVFSQNKFVAAGFLGLRPAITGLIAAAGYGVFLLAVFQNGALQWKAFLLFIALLISMQLKPLKHIHPVAYIFISAVIGIALGL